MDLFVPVFIGLIIIFGVIKKVPLFDAFVIGANGGFKTLVSIAPTLVGLIVAINMLKGSGVLECFSRFISPIADAVGFPTELVPLVLLRPISGSGATALLTSIYEDVGPDSFSGRVASVLAGSTETTFYAIAVYYGSVNVKKIRHTLISALSADLTAVIMAVVTVKMYFGQ